MDAKPRSRIQPQDIEAPRSDEHGIVTAPMFLGWRHWNRAAGSAYHSRNGERKGALTVEVVTKPLAFEGQARMQQARARHIGDDGISVDTTHCNPNEKMMEVLPRKPDSSSIKGSADEIPSARRQGHLGHITIPGISM